jgi:hypothetical protein
LRIGSLGFKLVHVHSPPVWGRFLDSSLHPPIWDRFMSSQILK